MKKGFDIHSYARRHQTIIENIKDKDSITPKNKQFLLDFDEQCVLDSLGVARRIRYLDILRGMAKSFDKDFDRSL